MGLCARETRGREGFCAETRNRAIVARFRARRVKRRRGMVRRGGVMARTRWWWWWWSCALVKREPERGLGQNPNPSRCGSIRARRVKWRLGMVGRGSAMVRMRWWWWWGGAFAKRETRSGWAKKKSKRAAVARFRVAAGLQEAEGGTVGLQFPSRAKMREGMGGVKWYGGWLWWLCSPARSVPFLLLLLFSTHSPPLSTHSQSTPNPPYSLLTDRVTVVCGRLRACSGRERRVDLTRLAEFQTPTIFDRDFDFHRSIFYWAPKIVKIIKYILYIYKNVSTILI